ncbi:MAG TPA: DUF6178 family protein [Polyangiaceae bacterium]|nr:DUF6178 family protein [Polyangiaceae bacterium]
MKSLGRHHVSSSRALLMHILERPELVSAVRELPGAVLGRWIDRIGLEDAGELVALASTRQLEQLLDEDLWKAEDAGRDETFRPDRFVLWLRVMLEVGEGFLAQRLAELPQDLLALAIHRLVLVVDLDVVEEQVRASSDELARELEKALEGSVFEEWEELRLIARDPDAWDDVWNAILLLDRDHHDRVRTILDQCCAMSTEYISGNGGLYEVLTSGEMLESDVSAAREDRRAAEGFVSPADARSFLELSRRGEGGERDPITRAYFRSLGGSRPDETERRESETPPSSAGYLDAASSPAEDFARLVALLEEAEGIAPAAHRPFPALTAGNASLTRSSSRALGKRSRSSSPSTSKGPAKTFERAMRDLKESAPLVFAERVEELGYLVNVWIAGGEHAGRRPRPPEALETVLQTCEAGLRSRFETGRIEPERALSVLLSTSADRLFRDGYRSR